jgi:glucose/arabinose dehydrogenase
MKTLSLIIALMLIPSFSSGRESESPAKPAVKTVRTFKNLRINRPIIITNANDGSNRLFIASQYGKVYVMPNDPSVETPDVFMDIQKQVTYKDRENEEGFLGLAFHPKYKSNGHLFVYYTSKKAPRLSVISRFTVSKSDPNHVDNSTEVEIMRIKQPFWNHNGGTICFGPDGYLYVGLGDGGAANDPQGNGQNRKTLLGSILRIDIDSKSGDKNYSIPKDNPYYLSKDWRNEIYAYGLRNVWRMSFDRKNGTGWIADVGQNLWEEINILEKNGNYGWNIRESMHPFEKAPRKEKQGEKFVDPIFEYNHETGKSITGGVVYRGKKHPELDGAYLYADYVTGHLWALKYNFDTKKANNMEILGEHINPEKQFFAPVITFGEDEAGEVYFSSVNGRIYTLGN